MKVMETSGSQEGRDVPSPALEVAARALLVGYALALPVRGTAGLQSALLISSFLFLVAADRGAWRAAWADARWLLAPLLLFSAWVFATSPFWREPALKSWDPSTWDMRQPWFSLEQWRRDLAQPMLAMLCGYRAFRSDRWRRWLFTFQGLLVAMLLARCLWLYFHGEMWGEPRIMHRGTLQVRGFSHDNIFFSYVLLLLTPGAIWLAFHGRRRLSGRVGLASLAILLFLIFLNKRRGTWTAVSVEAAVLAAWFGWRRFGVFALAALAGLLLAWTFRPHWFVREYDASNSGRVRIIADVGPLMREHPGVGVGFGKDTVVKNYWHRIYQHAHNTFLNVALGSGLPGLGLWVGALGAYALRFARAGRSGDLAGRVGLAFLLAFCVRNFADDVWVSSNAELFWFQIGVLMPPRFGGGR